LDPLSEAAEAERLLLQNSKESSSSASGDSALTPSKIASALLSLEPNVSLCGDSVFVDRIAHAPRPLLPTSSVMSKFGDSIAWQLEIGKPGNLTTLRAVELPFEEGSSDRVTRRPLPKRNEVEIRVYAAGVNFRDVLKALGLFLWFGMK
jgi:hypothetical protein